jgi:ABC-type glucose/galactose transport system permease subunit
VKNILEILKDPLVRRKVVVGVSALLATFGLHLLPGQLEAIEAVLQAVVLIVSAFYINKKGEDK